MQVIKTSGIWCIIAHRMAIPKSATPLVVRDSLLDGRKAWKFKVDGGPNPQDAGVRVDGEDADVDESRDLMSESGLMGRRQPSRAPGRTAVAASIGHQAHPRGKLSKFRATPPL